MEHPLNKSAVSSLPYDPTAIRDCAAHFTAASDSIRSVYNPCSDVGVIPTPQTIADRICQVEFYGVPVDVIKALIREHLPEYVL